MLTNYTKNDYLHFFCIFSSKNLVISKKSSTFALAFEKKPIG